MILHSCYGIKFDTLAAYFLFKKYILSFIYYGNNDRMKRESEVDIKMKFTDRIYQKIATGIANHANWEMPKVIKGNGSIRKLAQQLRDDGREHIFIVTTKGTIKRGTLDVFFAKLENYGIVYTIFDEVMPDPTISCINQAAEMYQKNDCDAIVAIGGGSVLDCAKVAAARIVKPKQSVEKMAGGFKIGKKLPPFYAVPTTAGTASETTIAAVVTDENTNYKFAVSDGCLLPDYAVLDPVLTKGMPPQLTAFTGMDALTHAIEAYTNLYSLKQSDKKARHAVKLIFENLEHAYEQGDNLEYRQKMLLASFYAGEAFTRSFVGYVHAIAHAIGGIYHVAHGEANAIILPYVLEAYGPSVYHSLSELAKVTGMDMTGNHEKDAKAFIQKIREMNSHMNIAATLPMILDKDIEEIVDRVYKEAHTYPTPVIWSKEELRKLILKMRG